jgi:phosphonate transport system substrate-binding protein
VLIDFSKQTVSNLSMTDTLPTLRIIIGAMTSPRETFVHYEALATFLGKKMGRSVRLIQRKTYQETNEAIGRKEVDLAFVCTGAFVEGAARNHMRLLVVPLINGEPFYQANVIVHRDSPFQKFTDLRGKSFAYTDPLSNTGYYYVKERLRLMQTTDREFFGKTLFSYGHDHSIQMVAKQLVEGASVDGSILDYLRQRYPDRVRYIRIIERSRKFGIPPVVVPSSIEPQMREDLEHLFMTMHTDSVGKVILAKLGIDRFERGDIRNYQKIVVP